MLLVSNRPNGGYQGRFREKAQTLVKAGTRVGMMPLSSEDKTCHCHVCDSDIERPVFEAGQKDHWGECPVCKTPFIFWLVA